MECMGHLWSVPEMFDSCFCINKSSRCTGICEKWAGAILISAAKLREAHIKWRCWTGNGFIANLSVHRWNLWILVAPFQPTGTQNYFLNLIFSNTHSRSHSLVSERLCLIKVLNWPAEDFNLSLICHVVNPACYVIKKMHSWYVRCIFKSWRRDDHLNCQKVNDVLVSLQA